MKIFLIILFSVIALFMILLLANIRLKLYLSKDGYLVLRYLFLRFRFELYGENQVKRKKKEKKKAPKKEKQGYIKKIYDKNGPLEGTSQLLSIIKLLLSKLFSLFSKATITKLDLNITVTGDDPAETAINYGAVSAVVYPTIGIINGIFTVKKQNVILNADYDSTEPKIYFKCWIKVRLISVIKVFISFIKDYIKNII